MDLTQIIGSSVAVPIDLQYHDIDNTNPIPVIDGWRLITLANEQVGASKVISVPVGKEYKITAIGLIINTTATVGNRLFCIKVLGDGTSTLNQINVFSLYFPTIAASLTKYLFLAPNLPRDTAYSTVPVAGYFYHPIPDIILKAGDRIIFTDDGAIDKTNDTIKYRVDVLERGV